MYLLANPGVKRECISFAISLKNRSISFENLGMYRNDRRRFYDKKEIDMNVKSAFVT
jgi:hypothetical protein